MRSWAQKFESLYQERRDKLEWAKPLIEKYIETIVFEYLQEAKYHRKRQRKNFRNIRKIKLSEVTTSSEWNFFEMLALNS